MRNIIVVEKLSFSYLSNISTEQANGSWVLKNISFKIRSGEFVIVAGKNGSGKSTLLRLLDLLLLPTEGKIYVFDQDTSLAKDPYGIRKKIGFVFQNPKAQMITNTVIDELVFGPENLGFSKTRIKNILEEVVTLTGIENLLHRRTDELSGGQKQLVAISSVLTMDPEIILLDEPTSMLNPEYHNKIIGVIENLNKNGKTIVMVTHKSEDLRLGDRVFVLKDGNLVFSSSPEKLFKDYENLIENSGLNMPLSVKLSKRLKSKYGEFPICLSIDEFSNKLANLVGMI